MFAVVYDEYVATFDEHGVIDAIDKADLCPHGDVFQIVNGCLEKCQKCSGPWHSDDVLYIKVTDAAGNVLAEGWGTDH